MADSLVAFLAREAPGLTWHWYVSYEADLGAFVAPGYRAAFVALLQQHVEDLRARRETQAVFWSPSFWRPAWARGCSPIR